MDKTNEENVRHSGKGVKNSGGRSKCGPSHAPFAQPWTFRFDTTSLLTYILISTRFDGPINL